MVASENIFNQGKYKANVEYGRGEGQLLFTNLTKFTSFQEFFERLRGEKYVFFRDIIFFADD